MALNPPTVLVAEDDPVSRRMLAKNLERLGCRCEVASDGEEAWEAYRRSSPDVLITDLMMPVLDGLGLCRRIREEADSGEIYIALLTALGGDEHHQRAVQSGADAFLTKPIWREQLQVVVDAAARTSRRRPSGFGPPPPATPSRASA